MNDGWFYVSLLCLMGVLFNHTLLPAVVPTAWTEGHVFWQVVFASDALLFAGALVTFGGAVMVGSSGASASDEAPGCGPETAEDGSSYPAPTPRSAASGTAASESSTTRGSEPR